MVDQPFEAFRVLFIRPQLFPLGLRYFAPCRLLLEQSKLLLYSFLRQCLGFDIVVEVPLHVYFVLQYHLQLLLRSRLQRRTTRPLELGEAGVPKSGVCQQLLLAWVDLITCFALSLVDVWKRAIEVRVVVMVQLLHALGAQLHSLSEHVCMCMCAIHASWLLDLPKQKLLELRLGCWSHGFSVGRCC